MSAPAARAFACASRSDETSRTATRDRQWRAPDAVLQSDPACSGGMPGRCRACHELGGSVCRRLGLSCPFAFDIIAAIDERALARVAINQALLRVVNEAIQPRPGHERIVFRCECGQLGCNQMIELTRAEYAAVRAQPRRFAVVPDHEVSEIETTVERHERYAVVEVHDQTAATVADRTAPKRRGAA